MVTDMSNTTTTTEVTREEHILKWEISRQALSDQHDDIVTSALRAGLRREGEIDKQLTEIEELLEECDDNLSKFVTMQLPTAEMIARREAEKVALAEGGCHKCGGRGSIEAFAHIEGGTCFACGGTGRA